MAYSGQKKPKQRGNKILALFMGATYLTVWNSSAPRLPSAGTGILKGRSIGQVVLAVAGALLKNSPTGAGWP